MNKHVRLLAFFALCTVFGHGIGGLCVLGGHPISLFLLVVGAAVGGFNHHAAGAGHLAVGVSAFIGILGISPRGYCVESYQ